MMSKENIPSLGFNNSMYECGESSNSESQPPIFVKESKATSNPAKFYPSVKDLPTKKQDSSQQPR